MKIFISTVILACALGAAQLRAQDGDIQAQSQMIRTLDVEGTSEIEMVPDIVRFSVGVEKIEKESEKAVEEATKTSNAIFDVLKQAGIEDEDIQSAGVQISFLYQGSSRGFFGSPEEYSAYSNIDVTLRDLEILPQLLADLGQAGATDMGGLGFDLSNRDEKNNEAMLLAVDDAFARASQIAERAGMALGDPIQIKFGRTDFPTPAEPVVLESGNVSYSADAASGRSSTPINISPGIITLSARVEIQYELVSKP